MKSIAVISKMVAPHFVTFASVASILGLFLYFVEKPYAVITALSAFILFLFALLVKIWMLINTFLKNHYTKGFNTNFSFIKYTTNDGKYIKHEVFRDIQCKKTIMADYEHGFKWSGTNAPVISSNLQEYGPIIKAVCPNDYDKVVFKFKSPLMYNQSSVLHIVMELNDSDGKAKPYIETKVDNPIQVIGYRIELLHKNGKYKGFAKLLKKPIHSALSTSYELMEQLQFNRTSKTYEHFLISPEIGYFYRLEWEQ